MTIREHIRGLKKDDYPFYDEYPDCREILLMGTGSSGKSSLINALNGAYNGLGGEEIAYVAKAKGKTFQLNFYHAKHNHKKRRSGMLVDSPGYGRTDAPVKLKNLWYRMLTKYLSYGIRLNLILLCVPANRGLTG